MDLGALFNRAASLAEIYDGSEPSYHAFTNAAIAYEQAGGGREKVDELLDSAIRAVFNVNREEDFIERLRKGGAQIFHHGAVFVRPDPEGEGLKNGEGEYSPPEKEPRLREIILALHGYGIYFDDLVIDIGRVSNTQMRIMPYVIVTIPRLNAQVVVAEQKGEAMFVANPAIPFMNWALFEKKKAGQENTPFANVTRIVHAGDWQDRLIKTLFGEDLSTGPKVHMAGYVRAHRKSKYPLTEEIVVAMARMYRERHPEKQWPSLKSGVINRDIILQVTQDSDWRRETWETINHCGRREERGINRSLYQILRAHGCHYDLTEELVVKMAHLYRKRHPAKRWPSQDSGVVDPAIVQQVTGDQHWQGETWGTINVLGSTGGRGLNRSLNQTLRAHGCHYDLTEEKVAAMAQRYRDKHPERKWPSALSGVVDPEIVMEVTGDPNWKRETWSGIDTAGKIKSRGLNRGLAGTLNAHFQERKGETATQQQVIPPPP